MKIGLAPFTIRHNVFNKETARDAYAKLKDLGFDGLENGLAKQGGLTLEEDLAEHEKYGLTICDIWGDPNDIEGSITRAKAYNTNYICVSTMPGDMMLNADGFKSYAEWLNDKAKPFIKEGYKLSYHNHAQEFRNFDYLGGKTGYEILLEETNPESIVFVLDVFWVSAAGGDPAYWLRKIKGRTSPVVHFKEYAIDDRSYDTNMGNIPWRFAEIGQGNINWKAVLEACKEIDIKWYCIEQDLCRKDAFISLKTSIDYMRNVLNIK